MGLDQAFSKKNIAMGLQWINWETKWKTDQYWIWAHWQWSPDFILFFYIPTKFNPLLALAHQLSGILPIHILGTEIKGQYFNKRQPGLFVFIKQKSPRLIP